YPALRREDERVDLDQVGVALDVATPELQQDVDRALTRSRIEVGCVDPLAARGVGEAVDGVDVDPRARVGRLRRDLLDLDAALGGEHAEVQLGPPIEGEAGVELAGDVGRVLDPDAAYDVALDVHAEDVAGVGAHPVPLRGQLDAARLAAHAHLHLGLHHDGVARLLGPSDGLGDRVRHPAGG